MPYIFISFANAHTGKNIGCCIVQSDNPQDANQKCKDLDLMPHICNEAKGYVLADEAEFKHQGMTLDRFYTSDEMMNMGFEKKSEKAIT